MTSRILVAEDDGDINLLLCFWLLGAGHDPLGVANGAEAVAAFCREREAGRPFDLLLLDICMPHMDGDAAALAVRHLDTAVPVIFLTGYGPEAKERERVRMVNHAGVIMKPVGLDELKAAVAGALSRGS